MPQFLKIRFQKTNIPTWKFNFFIVQASLAANTFAVQGHAEIKREYLDDLLTFDIIYCF